MSGSSTPSSRRRFLQTAGSSLAATSLLPALVSAGTGTIIKPPRLRAGDTVGLINPAGATYVLSDLEVVQEVLSALDLKVRIGAHCADRYGYLAGTDEARAADVNAMFADPAVRAVMAVRGGWGCNRILHLLDYVAIAHHPKILVGYSDITSLLVACFAKAGLITFHGPVGTSTWNQFSVGHFKRVLMEGAADTFVNPRSIGDNLAQTRDRITTITPGKARGRLVGGNLSVLTAMLGSPYLPPWEQTILFLEEDSEHIYRVDRMLTHLRIAGVLDRVAGVVIGKCTGCDPGEGYGSLTLEDVYRDIIAPSRMPAFAGAMIGHIENKFTVPVGALAEIDAEAGSIRLLESAVQ
ncbi:MAG: LD-carboxypeptidase [Ignavibacteriae bacterium]|nr:LD-carboxypeptidase [Ignavibacteriota bacterium]